MFNAVRLKRLIHVEKDVDVRIPLPRLLCFGSNLKVAINSSIIERLSWTIVVLKKMGSLFLFILVQGSEHLQLKIL